MKKLNTLIMAITASAVLMLSPLTHASGGHEAQKDEHGHQDEHQEPEKGPNNGRMLIKDDFAIEVAIYERGVPPQFRVFASYQGHKVDPKQVTLAVKLFRLGGEVDDIGFVAEGEHLSGDATVYEPHSFVVDVTAQYQGKTYHWQYDNFEGRTQISEQMANNMGVVVEQVTSQVLTETLKVYGKLVLPVNAQRTISARYPGKVTQLTVALGQQVTKGDHLLTIESDANLQPYKVYAPISGVVSAQLTAIGEQTAQNTLLMLTDTDTLIAELNVFTLDQSEIQLGDKVNITIPGTSQSTTSQLFDALINLNSQQAKVYRAKVNNSNGQYNVGQFIEAEIETNQFTVPLAVKAQALQSFRDFTVVYRKVDDQYEVRMLTLGRKAGQWVEVLSGIDATNEYVTSNSYLIKADIDKAGASHDH